MIKLLKEAEEKLDMRLAKGTKSISYEVLEKLTTLIVMKMRKTRKE